jgi:high-affinity Fe2+/Pb2+ permease
LVILVASAVAYGRVLMEVAVVALIAPPLAVMLGLLVSAAVMVYFFAYGDKIDFAAQENPAGCGRR